jgi:hypothetical protein
VTDKDAAMASISKLPDLHGGGGGGQFDDFTQSLQPNGLGFVTHISTLEVNAGATLDHLRVSYQIETDPNGSPLTIQHGASNGGAVFPSFVVFRGEKLVRIEGWLDVFNGTLQVRGLRFSTNSNRDSGVLGASTSNPFNVAAPSGGEIVALWGREGLFLDALGVYVRVD